MASKGWVLLPLTLFLFPLLIESRSPPSAPPHHPHHHHQPFEFIKNLEGCHKGETVKGIHKLKQYLEHFGYLPRHSTNTTNTNSHKNVGTDNDSFDEQLELAIKSYQRNYHLNVTGELDVETAEQMMKPRCGVADIINGKSSMRSGKGRHLYTFFPNSPRWPSSKTRLTYGFLQGVQVISLQNHRTICKSAFDKWSAVSHFTFEEAQNVASADIKIGFFSRGHGDNAPFDGAGGVLAHAFAPTRGWFHYDADENWAINPTATAFDVESVAVHEIGHLLGLGHSQDRNAIMFPSIGPGQKKGETVKGIHKLKQYLEHFGYLPRHSTNTTNTNSHKNVGTDNDSFDEQLELAIKSYQRNYHLNVTGELDVETAEQMMKPRCGVADIINGKSSMRSGKGRHLYTFFPNSPRWPSSKTRLTYGFLQGVQVISLQNHRTICKSAFDKWSAVSHFTFEEAQNVASADIKIGFFSRGHGDNAPFDGAGGVLAHAFAPTRGWFHYDADENWAINPTANAFDVESVAVHEIGHLLGLGHSQDRNAIMFPSIGRGQKKVNLGQDDINGIRALYRHP
ncbi:hypothetical protein AAC387_Pa04g2512 [Persea americana]